MLSKAERQVINCLRQIEDVVYNLAEPIAGKNACEFRCRI